MKEHRLITPPEIVPTSSHLIFLAGPIQGTWDWQTDAAAQIHERDSRIIVASPRKEYLDGSFNYQKQVNWETEYLRRAGRAGVIGFWLAAETEPIEGRAYAQTTRFELAEWKMRHEYMGAALTIGIEPGFSGEKYIRQRFSEDAPEVAITDSLETFCANAVELLHQRHQNDE